jgi:hypothetical protein
VRGSSVMPPMNQLGPVGAHQEAAITTAAGDRFANVTCAECDPGGGR